MEKCVNCEKEGFNKIDDEWYCKGCYCKEKYGCKSVMDYLKKRRIKFLTSVIDGHIILRKEVKQVSELCNIFDLETWVLQDYFHIGDKND